MDLGLRMQHREATRVAADSVGEPLMVPGEAICESPSSSWLTMMVRSVVVDVTVAVVEAAVVVVVTVVVAVVVVLATVPGGPQLAGSEMRPQLRLQPRR